MHKMLSISEVRAKEWQREFPILSNINHLGNCSQAPQAKKVRTAIESYLENWLTVGMDWDFWVTETIKAKHEFAKLINASPEEIAITTSLSEATASIFSALDPKGNKRKIVVTEAEFPTVGQIALAYEKFGYEVEFVPVREGKINLEDYESIVDSDTIITAATHIYYQNGFKQNIKEIANIVHQKGSLLYVDAYQSLGTTAIDVKKLGIDILASGNLKYLLGIPGIAFVYVKKELIPSLKPAITGWFGMEDPFSFQVDQLDYAHATRRFETGTPPVLTAFAARAGMEIINEAGIHNIEERLQELSRYTLDLSLAKGFNVVSPLNLAEKGSMTAIHVPHSHHFEAEMKKRRIIVSARGDVIRFAPHFFTTKENIDEAVEQLASILQL